MDKIKLINFFNVLSVGSAVSPNTIAKYLNKTPTFACILKYLNNDKVLRAKCVGLRVIHFLAILKNENYFISQTNHFTFFKKMKNES